MRDTPNHPDGLRLITRYITSRCQNAATKAEG